MRLSHDNSERLIAIPGWRQGTIQVDADDTTNAVVGATGTIGQVQIVARADADLGTGVRELLTTMDVEVVAGEAVSGIVTPVGESAPISR